MKLEPRQGFAPCHPVYKTGVGILRAALSNNESGGYGGCCPRLASLDRRGLMLFRLVSVVRRERICTLTVRKHMFYRHAGSLVPRRRIEMVDRLGNAPSRGCLQGILEPLFPARGKLVAGAGVEPARARLMRPLPSRLAPPRS
jgi:hypothetical protein